MSVNARNGQHARVTSRRSTAVAAAPAPTRESQWEAVYRATRERILTLELPPGSPISEASVAGEFGTSPTPARDAIGRLRQEGLVILSAGRRYSVAPLALSDIRTLCELRFVIESGIARTVMQRKPTGAALDHVREVAKTLEAPNLGFAELISRNQDFHLAVAELTDNERLVDALRRVMEDSRRIFHLGIPVLPVADMVRTHETYVTAIETGDIDSAVHVCDIEAYGTAERVVGQLMRGVTINGRRIDVSPAAADGVGPRR